MRRGGGYWAVGFVLVCLGVGLLGGAITAGAIDGWYVYLAKPNFAPPNWVFGPVWTSLYALMGVSGYLAWKKKVNLNWFWAQLGFNFMWSMVFFGLRNPGLAFLEIVGLWGAIAKTILSFSKVRWAGAILIPYLMWVSFAGMLNFLIWRLN
jgi:tryptophan-rich sensory protein